MAIALMLLAGLVALYFGAEWLAHSWFSGPQRARLLALV